jgi:hypothetical protein
MSSARANRLATMVCLAVVGAGPPESLVAPTSLSLSFCWVQDVCHLAQRHCSSSCPPASPPLSQDPRRTVIMAVFSSFLISGGSVAGGS